MVKWQKKNKPQIFQNCNVKGYFKSFYGLKATINIKVRYFILQKNEIPLKMSRTRRIFHFYFILFSCVKFEMGNEIQNITYVIRNCYFKVVYRKNNKKKEK